MPEYSNKCGLGATLNDLYLQPPAVEDLVLNEVYGVGRQHNSTKHHQVGFTLFIITSKPCNGDSLNPNLLQRPLHSRKLAR